ncbi:MULTISPECIES: ATP-binding protein [Gammaproteobacteria]|uniref:sensor histidine kinase n=1 Tax=Gammaproteobacteria TaxID=1236 RepID=UPI000DD05B65|nr:MULTISPECIES: ATP-binding protein [Gammaproteobacteria]RTE86585.1 hypothetical protein DQX04_08505 [Aliidiomarina sp. B3213]TCZ90860.1 hypothetical protein EYQ95_08540 [Lysobacter sp. N42]
MGKQIYGWIVLALLLVAFLIGLAIVQPYRLWLYTKQERDMQQTATNVNSFILEQLREPIFISVGVTTYIQSLEGDIEASRLNRWLENLFDYTEHTKNIGIAPNNVIEHIYPLAGNEAALGLRFADLPAQWPAIQRLMEGGPGQLTGPISLVQGGRAFAYREAINVNGDYWGLVSTIIDADSIYNALNVYLAENSIFDVYLTNSAGTVFFETSGIENNKSIIHVSQTLRLPGTEWQISVVEPAPTQTILVFLVASTALLFSILLLVMWLLYSYKKRAEEKDELNRLQAAFLASVSHELKTPITVLQGSLALMAQPQITESKRSELLESALTHQKRLSRLVVDLIDLNLALNGQLRCHLEPTLIMPLLEELTSLYVKKFERLNIRFRTELGSAKDVSIKLDKDHVYRVIEHLLDNAIKFCSSGDEVTIGIDESESFKIWITDTGPGIPDALIESKGFHFFQEDNTDTKEQSGTGMGLALCYEFTKLSGGTMKLAHRSGGGTYISLTWPRLLMTQSNCDKDKNNDES